MPPAMPPGPIAPTTTDPIGGLYAEQFAPDRLQHCGRYREVAHVLLSAGWAVVSYDVRGHGGRPAIGASSIDSRSTSKTSRRFAASRANVAATGRSCCSAIRRAA